MYTIFQDFILRRCFETLEKQVLPGGLLTVGFIFPKETIHTQLIGLEAKQMIHELLGGSAGYAAVTHLPLICLQTQFLLIHGNTALLCKLLYDIVVLLTIRLEVSDGHTETIAQRQFLFDGIAVVDILGILAHIVAVAPGLLDQVTAVRGCIDQNVLWSGLNTTFDDCL